MSDPRLIIDNFEYATDALARAAWETYLSETLEFSNRVIADGGTIISLDGINEAIKNAKDNSYYSNISGWYSALFAYKNGGSGKVSKLYDISPNNNDIISASGSEPAYTDNQQNGLACIVTTGSKYLSKNSTLQTTTAYSMFLAFKLDATKGTQVIVSNGSLNSNGYGFYTASGARNIIHGGAVSLSNGSTTTNFELWEGIHAAGDRRFYINSETPTSDAGDPKTPTTNFLLGTDNSSNYAPGKYGEFLILNTNASTAQRQAIETLLNGVWGIY